MNRLHWRQIAGTDYHVSRIGDVWNAGRKALIKPRIDRYGYKRVDLVIEGRRKTLRVHRLVAEHFLSDFWPGCLVDHKDNDRLNNAVENLRCTTEQQNSANTRARAGSSKYRGVYYNKALDRWRARANYKGKEVYIGNYRTEEEAAKAYDAKCRELFGVHGRYNFPIAGEQSALCGQERSSMCG